MMVVKVEKAQANTACADTGKRAWRFYIVPGDPSKPSEDEAQARAARTWSVVQKAGTEAVRPYL